MKTHPGKLTISRPSGGFHDDQICITLHDEFSGTQCVEIHVPLDSFAKALTNAARQPCEFEWRPEKVGLKREVKEEYVRDLGGSDFSLAPYRLEGWYEVSGRWGNHHYGQQGKGYRVAFERWIEPTP